MVLRMKKEGRLTRSRRFRVHANPALSPHGPDLPHRVMPVDFVQRILPTTNRSLTQVSPLPTQCNVSTMFDLLRRHDQSPNHLPTHIAVHEQAALPLRCLFQQWVEC